jgi:eukaryotic-like serine/threonine-protein kinase
MRRLGDRFVVEEALGAGGMGSIYRGRDERLGEEVAIKILKPAHLDDAVLRERFRREALSLAKLRHPGIVTVLDFGEADGDLYTVLELVRGETLERVMDRERAMTILRAGPVFDQILAALEVCHENDIVHRDIKPSNVMVSSVNGALHVKLIDFGLARIGDAGAIDKLTETGTVQGTPHYMAPEQCRGEDVGPAGDIYSAGVLFYEMLAGSNPFRGSDAATFMAQHLFVEPPPLTQVAPHVSAGVSAAIGAALAKQPQDRPTAHALRDALTSAAKGTDPEALGQAAATLRRHASGLERSERALTGHTPAAQPPRAPLGNVTVWMSMGDRSAALRGCLATAGLSCTLWSTDEVPDVSGANVAVVVSARDALARVRRLRELAPKLVIVVVDVDGPDETTEAIRAGASDMLLREAPDADLAKKMDRLLRRRARS